MEKYMKGVWCLTLCLTFSHVVISDETKTCQIDNNGCHVTVQLNGKSQCTKVQFGDLVYARRSKRSDVDDDSQPITRAEFKKLSKKVTKTLEKLSVRVLRWWRQLSRKIDELHDTGPKERSLSELSQHCPDRFIGIKDWTSCYLLSNFNSSWYDAKEYCGAFDGDLVSMGTVKEHYLITFLIKNDPELRKAEGWWTSGSYHSNRKQWIWASDMYSHQFTFIKWGSGEPNEEGSQCMFLKKSDDHMWHDEICTQRFNFICEVQPSALIPHS